MGFLSEIKKVFTKEYKEETKRQESNEVFLKNNVDKFKFSGDNYDVHETIDRLKKAEAQTEFKQTIEVFDAAINGIQGVEDVTEKDRIENTSEYRESVERANKRIEASRDQYNKAYLQAEKSIARETLKNNTGKSSTFKNSKLNNDFYIGYLEETAKRLKLLKGDIPDGVKNSIIDLQVKIFNIVKEEQGVDVALFIGDKQKAENFKKEMNKFVKSRDDEDEIER